MEKKNKERKILLKRFFWENRRIYKLGKALRMNWFDQFDYKFYKDTYAYFADEEKKEAIEKIADSTQVSDEKFVIAFNQIELPKYSPDIPLFIGEHYYVYIDVEKGIKKFKLENRQSEVRKEVKEALKDTKERGYYFLKAIIDLKKEEKWDKAYGGVPWIDLLSKIREIGGRYPAPRDLAILRSYKMFYFKTGSRRYPTHTVPEEMIKVVEKTLKEWKEKRS